MNLLKASPQIGCDTLKSGEVIMGEGLYLHPSFCMLLMSSL